MSHFSLCQKDPLVDLVRNQLGCNPVLRPSTQHKPLDLLHVRDGKTQNIGQVSGYLKEPFDFPRAALKPDKITDFSGKDSSQVKLDFGLQLLSRLTGASPAKEDLWKTYFSGKEQVSFQFHEVEAVSADLALLRDILRFNRVSTDDPVFSEKNWIGKPQNQFFVITKTIVCPRFSVKFGNNGGFQVSPQLKTDIADANLAIADSSSIALLLEHRSDVPLTFAFVCHQIKIGESGEVFPLIETGKVPPLAFGAVSRSMGGAVLLSDEPVLLDVQ